MIKDIIKIIFTFLFLINCLNLKTQDKNIADSLLNIYNEGKYIKGDSSELQLYLDLAFYHPNPDTTILFADLLISKASQVSNVDLWLYRGYLHQGNAYRIKGYLDLAVESYFKSLNSAIKCKNKKREGVVYTALGDTYGSAKNQTNSIFYYNKAIKILRNHGDSIALGATLLNLGSQYLDFNMVDTATIYLEESNNIFRLIDYEIGLAYNLGIIGLTYAKKGKYFQAENDIIKASEILKKLGDYYSISAFNTSLAKIYISEKKYSKALIPASFAYTIAKENGLLIQLRDASDKLAFIYSKLGNYEKAYNYQSQYIVYRDSINNEETIRKMADLRTEYEVAQKQIELEKTQTTLELSNNKRQNQQIIGLVLIVLLLLIIFFTYYYYTSRQKNLVLQTKSAEQRKNFNSVLIAQEDERKRIATELHDSVGPLLSISQLYMSEVLASEKSPESETSYYSRKSYEAIDEACREVRSISHNLMSSVLIRLGLAPACNELVRKIRETKAFDISFINSGYKNRLDESIEVCFYRILQELLNNVIKHSQASKVEVSLSLEHNELKLKVKDNGVGFNVEKTQSFNGLGLQSIYSRLSLINGEIEIDSSNKGTIAQINVPIIV